MSLDLNKLANKLANKLDEALIKETTETLTKFLTDKRMINNKQSSVEDLAYWKNNAEENYMTTPISVLKYIHKLEEHIETIKAQLPSDEEIEQIADACHPYAEQIGGDIYVAYRAFKQGLQLMRDKIQGGNK